MEARKKVGRFAVSVEGTMDNETKQYLNADNEKDILYIALSEKIDKILLQKLVDLGDTSAQPYGTYFGGTERIIDDINKAFNDKSSNYIPLSKREIKAFTPALQLFFSIPSQRLGLFSCGKKPDLKTERQNFIKELFGNEFEELKIFCSRYKILLEMKSSQDKAYSP